MRLRSWRGSTPLSTSTRRPFPWVRSILVIALVALLAYIFLPDYFYLRADALVQGNLVPVTPIYRIRVDNLLVQCNDRVTAGQKLAITSNFLVQADYQRQYLETQQQEQVSQVALEQNVAEAKFNAESLHQKYVAAMLDEGRIAATVKSYDQGYTQGAVSQIEWQDKHAELRTASAETESSKQAWQRAEQQVGQIEQDQNAKLASDRQLMSQSQSLATQVGSQPLVAPVSGYIVNCVERPQNVIEPGTALFDIYSPDRAYVMAYFNPNAVQDVQLGEKVKIQIAGISDDVTGHVISIYPDLSKLPAQLTRFFWQHVQFAEYRPVKIAIDVISKEDRQKLYYDAQARVFIDRHRWPGKSGDAVSVDR